MTQLLTLQLSELKAERTVLLDRLATIGLGGPLFNLPTLPDSSQSTAAEEELTEEEAERIFEESLKRTPSKWARWKEVKARIDRNKLYKGPSVARIPDLTRINSALDQAEALGKKQA